MHKYKFLTNCGVTLSFESRYGGNKTAVGPERDKNKTSEEGYYFHFHLSNRTGGNLFYY